MSQHEPTAAPSSTLFRAFTQRQQQRRWQWWLVAAGAVAIIGAVVQSNSKSMTLVVTQRGFHLVRHGMTPGEVKGILGTPLNIERNAEGAECLDYGRPTLEAPSFIIYRACYANGALVDMSQRRFAAHLVGPDGLPHQQ